ncbi:MAG: 8-hydroxy-5-deazaflavin:NADPH oxidoreductase [Frankiales bacterium]|nr:8-hydroxy-5-deazaflavin:NADPH oxidoreductase [Frankiales bacterium]
MRIGLLGSGVVGQALSSGYQRHGHETQIAGRGGFADVAGWAELVVLAVAGSAAEAVAAEVAAATAGKVLIDATNPLDHSSGAPRLFVGFDDSLGERVQRAAPETRVVKAYNIVGNGSMVDPQLPGGPPTMLICGEDDAAKATVTELLESTGWEVADLGGIGASRYLEPMCLAWVLYGVRTGGWDHAFKLLR